MRREHGIPNSFAAVCRTTSADRRPNQLVRTTPEGPKLNRGHGTAVGLGFEERDDSPGVCYGRVLFGIGVRLRCGRTNSSFTYASEGRAYVREYSVDRM